MQNSILSQDMGCYKLERSNTCASIEITILSKDLFLRYCENCEITHILNVHLLPHSELLLPCDCCGLGRHPSSLLPQLCSGTLVCSGGAERCLELETDACHGDSKELPGRVVRGPGELRKMPSVTFFSCSRDGKLCYLLRREGQSQAFLFCLDSSKAEEIKLQLT